MKKINKKTLYIFIAILLLMLLLFFLLLFIKTAKEKASKSFVLENNLSRMEYDLRHLRFAENDEFIGLAEELSKNWREINKQYPVDPPLPFSKTREWPQKSWQINEDLSRIGEFAQEKNQTETLAVLTEAETAYLAIKKENNIPDFSQEIYAFYLESKKLETAENKADILEILPEFKLQFTQLKERLAQYSQTKIMVDLEAMVYTLNRQLDGPELRQAQKDLPNFVKYIYLNN